MELSNAFVITKEITSWALVIFFAYMTLNLGGELIAVISVSLILSFISYGFQRATENYGKIAAFLFAILIPLAVNFVVYEVSVSTSSTFEAKANSISTDVQKKVEYQEMFTKMGQAFRNIYFNEDERQYAVNLEKSIRTGAGNLILYGTPPISLWIYQLINTFLPLFVGLICQALASIYNKRL